MGTLIYAAGLAMRLGPEQVRNENLPALAGSTIRGC